MRRFLAIVSFIILFFLFVTVLVYTLGITKFDSFFKKETSIASVILVSLELIGILAAIAVVFIILFQYFRYRRPYRLVFDAFSNEPDLEEKPLNLSILVQEELIRQFKLIYTEINHYSEKNKEKNKSKKKNKDEDKEGQDFDALIADELYIEEGSLGNGIGSYVPIDQVKKEDMIEDLKEVIKSLKDSQDINLMSLVGEIVPKEIAPVSKVIEAIIPPHVIKATAYLQWRSNGSDSDGSDDTNKVGITFKYVDLSNQRNLMVRTLWWRPSKKLAVSANSLSPAKAFKANKNISSQVVADRYIELLSPATHWMALMFWEQKLLSNVPPVNRILKIREKKRQAGIFYLLGSLYYAHADQFPAYKSFFCQLAVEHFRQASIADTNWNLPYLYLANLYSFKAQETRGDKSEKLRKDARKLYDLALKHTKETETEIYTRARIILDEALAVLDAAVRLRSEKCYKEAEKLREEAVSLVEALQKKINPARFDPERADCAAYLYNLAAWFDMAYKNDTGIANVKSRDEARRYLAYSLVRSPSLKDKIENDENSFKSMKEEGDLKELLELLEEALDKNSNLAKLTGDEFKREIDTILDMVDQRLGR
jgi:hypothetical protein